MDTDTITVRPRHTLVLVLLSAFARKVLPQAPTH